MGITGAAMVTHGKGDRASIIMQSWPWVANMFVFCLFFSNHQAVFFLHVVFFILIILLSLSHQDDSVEGG